MSVLSANLGHSHCNWGRWQTPEDVVPTLTPLRSQISASPVPRIQASHAERLEVPDITGHRPPVGGLCDRGDDGVGVRGMFGYPIGGQNASGWQVEGQHSAVEGGQ